MKEKKLAPMPIEHLSDRLKGLIVERKILRELDKIIQQYYRSEPAPGRRFIRTPMDVLYETGKLSAENIYAEYEHIQNKKSELPRTVRDEIIRLVTNARFKATTKQCDNEIN